MNRSPLQFLVYICIYIFFTKVRVDGEAIIAYNSTYGNSVYEADYKSTNVFDQEANTNLINKIINSNGTEKPVFNKDSKYFPLVKILYSLLCSDCCKENSKQTDTSSRTNDILGKMILQKTPKGNTAPESTRSENKHGTTADPNPRIMPPENAQSRSQEDAQINVPLGDLPLWNWTPKDKTSRNVPSRKTQSEKEPRKNVPEEFYTPERIVPTGYIASQYRTPKTVRPGNEQLEKSLVEKPAIENTPSENTRSKNNPGTAADPNSRIMPPENTQSRQHEYAPTEHKIQIIVPVRNLALGNGTPRDKTSTNAPSENTQSRKKPYENLLTEHTPQTLTHIPSVDTLSKSEDTSKTIHCEIRFTNIPSKIKLLTEYVPPRNTSQGNVTSQYPRNDKLNVSPNTRIIRIRIH